MSITLTQKLVDVSDLSHQILTLFPEFLFLTFVVMI